MKRDWLLYLSVICLLGGPWPFKVAKAPRPSAVSLKVWLRETNGTVVWVQPLSGGSGLMVRDASVCTLQMPGRYSVPVVSTVAAQQEGLRFDVLTVSVWVYSRFLPQPKDMQVRCIEYYN